MESWSIKVHKDYLKFSAAHFLIFPDGTAERLHGHNYKVFVEVHSALDEHGLVLNFQDIKPRIRELVDELDEHLLLPGEHPTLQIGQLDPILHQQRCGQSLILFQEGKKDMFHVNPLMSELGRPLLRRHQGFLYFFSEAIDVHLTFVESS